MAGEILRQTESLRIAQDHSDNVSGSMLATTTDRRDMCCQSLLPVLSWQLRVSLEMRQGQPQQIAEMAAKGSVDFAIATGATNTHHW